MINTITLNPSLDYVVKVDGFKADALNRSNDEKIYAGGKGINVSIVLKNLGVDNSNVRKLLEKNINETKLRESKVNFGLITYNLSDRKPVEITKNDIPKGKLIEYILASSYLPIFKVSTIVISNSSFHLCLLQPKMIADNCAFVLLI